MSAEGSHHHHHHPHHVRHHQSKEGEEASPHLFSFNLTRERHSHIRKVRYDSSHAHPHIANKLIPSQPLPDYVDLRVYLPPCYDQGKLGSCTANALAAVMAYMDWRHDDSAKFMSSRLFIYFNERNMEGTTTNDSGACLSDGVNSLYAIGVCAEHVWPYAVDRFRDKPTSEAYNEADNYKVKHYEHVDPSIDNIKRCLAAERVIVLGIQIYPPFQSKEVARTGLVPMPAADEKSLGGHAVLCVGYDDSRGVWIMRNSWGERWGDGGYFYLPYDYLTDQHLATDMWVLYDEEHPHGPPTPIKRAN